MQVARPSLKNCMLGNCYAFAATGLGWLCWELCFQSNSDVVCLFLGGLAGMAAAKFGYRAVLALYEDYKARRDWIVAQRPATRKRDARWATYQEMAEVGMYEPKGRILGTDLEGRLLFEPHKLSPTFSYFYGPQGSGKTSTRVLTSALLTPLLAQTKR